jgi:hypothetical protein
MSQRAPSSGPAETADPGWGSSAPAPSVDLEAVGASARRAVQAYYVALETEDFQTAWLRLSGPVHSQFGGYNAWTRGYANSLSQKLTSISADATDINHATLTIALRSRDRDACGSRVTQRWSGTWTLARPAGRWIARAVSISRTGGETPITDASACPSSNATTQTNTPRSGDTTKVCYPGITVPAVTIPATTIPAVTIPATTIGGVHYPARHLPRRTLPARNLPARQLGGGCFQVPSAFALDQTTEFDDSTYAELDAAYSAALTQRYRAGVGSSYSYPDPTARGFGELNAAGYPKNQYVRPYVRRDGTMVSGYWRNSPSDGLPTCRVISC